jgi:hypothetical protein
MIHAKASLNYDHSFIVLVTVIMIVNSEHKIFIVQATGPVRSGPIRSGQVRSGQVRSGQVRSGQVRSGQVRSGQVRFKK